MKRLWYLSRKMNKLSIFCWSLWLVIITVIDHNRVAAFLPVERNSFFNSVCCWMIRLGLSSIVFLSTGLGITNLALFTHPQSLFPSCGQVCSTGHFAMSGCYIALQVYIIDNMDLQFILKQLSIRGHFCRPTF